MAGGGSPWWSVFEKAGKSFFADSDDDDDEPTPIQSTLRSIHHVLIGQPPRFRHTSQADFVTKISIKQDSSQSVGREITTKHDSSQFGGKIPAELRVAGWLPSSDDRLDEWLRDLLKTARSSPQYQATYRDMMSAFGLPCHAFPDRRSKLPDPQSQFEEELQPAGIEVCDDDTDFAGKCPRDLNLLPAVEELHKLIEDDTIINILFQKMILQAADPSWSKKRKGTLLAKNYCQMLYLINIVIQQAPEYNETGVVGCPITVILARTMGTSAGFSLFLNEKLNRQLKKILNYWTKFLKSEDSTYVLTTDSNGWFCEAALKEMPDFVNTFKCDPTKDHFGFTSWDGFFTRELRDGARPVASPKDNSVIVHACESKPYRLAKDVKYRTRFWIKSQPYSLYFMLNEDPLVEEFHYGTVYQAFLTSRCYHRWHSPVDGQIVKTLVVDGSYFAELEFQELRGQGDELQNESQGYLTEVATRAIIFIEAKNPKIGLMCFVAIGMVEISSCEVTVREGDNVKKGQQLGMFHYGGSTHCLIFRPSVKLDFEFKREGIEPGIYCQHILKVNSKFATVL